MSCEWWRDGISALVDGEEPGYDPALLDAHLARCPACRRFRDDAEAEAAQRAADLTIEGPDLSRSVASRVASDDRARHPRAARLVLTVLALTIIVLNAPEMFAAHGSEHSVHEMRHLAGFSAAYAVGLLVVVARPARARTMLSIGVVVAATMAITGFVDAMYGEVPLGGELVHIVEVASVIVLWTLTVPPSPTLRGRRLRLPSRGDDRRPAEASNTLARPG